MPGEDVTAIVATVCARVPHDEAPRVSTTIEGKCESEAKARANARRSSRRPEACQIKRETNEPRAKFESSPVRKIARSPSR